ncbi:MAG: FkbM family methyltransferase [Bacteroidota bacterium]|nr:FkbM family methyltransferase [Bacteroidota bacterium]
MSVKDLRQTLSFILNHPATRKSRWAAFWRFAGWQFESRIFRHPVIYPFVEKSKIIVQGGMTGSTGNIYTGLHEFEEMMFLLHLLRPADLFADVGANVGSYTILASSVAGAGSISFEPLPATFLHLKNNAAINNMESLVELYNCGVGNKKDKLRFTSGFDTMNHVITGSSDSISGTVEVDVVRLDDILGERTPALMKIDTEGFEMAVLQGAASVLKHSPLLAIIIELNGCCHRYGVQEQDIHELITGYGFLPVSYDPFRRCCSKESTFNQGGNTIYMRNEKEVEKRLQAARKYQVLDQAI